MNWTNDLSWKGKFWPPCWQPNRDGTCIEQKQQLEWAAQDTNIIRHPLWKFGESNLASYNSWERLPACDEHKQKDISYHGWVVHSVAFKSLAVWASSARKKTHPIILKVACENRKTQNGKAANLHPVSVRLRGVTWTCLHGRRAKGRTDGSYSSIAQDTLGKEELPCHP